MGRQDAGEPSDNISVNSPGDADAPSGLSWDELDVATTQTKSAKSKTSSKSSSGDDDLEDFDESDSEGEDEDFERSQDSDSSESDDNEESTSKDTEKEKADQDPKDKGSKIKPKVYKAKILGKDAKISADDEITLQVDGQIKSLKVQELVTNYNAQIASAKIDSDKKSLQDERTKFETDRQTVNESVGRLHKLAVEEGKPFEAIQFLTEMMGGDAAELLEQVEDKILEAAEAMLAEGPDARKTRRLERRNELLKQKQDRLTKANEDTLRNQSLETQVKSVQSKYNMTEEQFVSTYQELKGIYAQNKNLNPKTLDAELVGEYYLRNATRAQISTITGKNKWGSEGAELLFKEWSQDKTLTMAELEEIGRQVFGKPDVKRLKEKEPEKGQLRKKIERSSGGKVLTPPPRAKRNDREPITFDDL